MQKLLIPTSIFVSATLFSWGLGRCVYPLLRRWNLIDHPNVRSSHGIPTARGGGIAIMGTVLFGAMVVAVSRNAAVAATLAASSFTVAAVSLWDDLRPLSAALRFGCHALAAAGTLRVLRLEPATIELFAMDSWQIPLSLTTAIYFLWLAGYTSAFNFMDGINGIAASQAVVTAIGTALVAGTANGDLMSGPVLLSMVIAGAAAGFLPYNFPAAKMFMGDVGSAPLGFLLAGLALWTAASYGWWLLLPLGLLHANFVLDTAITLVRRIIRGERWHAPHREHFYQRLARSGYSHTWVTGWEAGLQGLALGMLLLAVQTAPLLRASLYLGVVMLWLAFFTFAEIRFRQTRACGSPPSPRSHAQAI